MRPEGEQTALDVVIAAHGAPPRDALARGVWLRRFFAPDAAARAATQLELRERAAGRLPVAERLWLTRAGLEQATHGEVAAARAARIAASLGPGARVLDATCGLGGESAAMARAGLRVVAADLDAETAACAAHNLAVWGAAGHAGRGAGSGAVLGTVRADALAPPLAAGSHWTLLLDPSRRAGGRRSLEPTEWSPSWPALAAAFPRYRGVAVKLAPASRPEELESALPSGWPRHWVWTSRRGELAELCLLGGALAGAEPGREAAVLARDGSGRVDGRHRGPAGRAPDAEPTGDPAAAAWIAVPDPALVASGLLGPVAAAAGHAPVGRGIAFTAGARPAATPGLRDLRVLGSAKLDRKAVRRLLAAHDVGRLRVLARGVSESADQLAARFRGPGAGRGVAVVARCDSGRRLWLVEEGPQSRPD